MGKLVPEDPAKVFPPSLTVRKEISIFPDVDLSTASDDKIKLWLNSMYFRSSNGLRKEPIEDEMLINTYSNPEDRPSFLLFGCSYKMINIINEAFGIALVRVNKNVYPDFDRQWKMMEDHFSNNSGGLELDTFEFDSFVIRTTPDSSFFNIKECGRFSVRLSFFVKENERKVLVRSKLIPLSDLY